MNLDDRLLELFGSSAGFENGLGIIETGQIAGGLSALCEVGFSVLGNLSVLATSDMEVIELAKASRTLGELSQGFARFIPAIPDIDIEQVTTFSGRLKDVNVGEVLAEQKISNSECVEMFFSGLLPIVRQSCIMALQRCSELSDKTFSRFLRSAVSIIDELGEDWIAVGPTDGLDGTSRQLGASDVLRALNLDSE